MQVSLLNFVRYNVSGGGDSSLYGVESVTYYLRNGANQLNTVLPLALIGFPLLLLLSWLSCGLRQPQRRLLVALSPAALWLVALSLLPHKEERFLYVIYPLVGTFSYFQFCASPVRTRAVHIGSLDGSIPSEKIPGLTMSHFDPLLRGYREVMTYPEDWQAEAPSWFAVYTMIASAGIPFDSGSHLSEHTSASLDCIL